jgi:hypothetical protein
MQFILGCLAVWRVCHMLAYEDGPWDIILRTRRRLGRGMLGNLMDCVGCSSIWVSLPVATYLNRQWGKTLVLTWLSLSAGTLLIEALYGLLRGQKEG